MHSSPDTGPILQVVLGKNDRPFSTKMHGYFISIPLPRFGKGCVETFPLSRVSFQAGNVLFQRAVKRRGGRRVSLTQLGLAHGGSQCKLICSQQLLTHSAGESEGTEAGTAHATLLCSNVGLTSVPSATYSRVNSNCHRWIIIRTRADADGHACSEEGLRFGFVWSMCSDVLNTNTAVVPVDARELPGAKLKSHPSRCDQVRNQATTRGV